MKEQTKKPAVAQDATKVSPEGLWDMIAAQAMEQLLVGTAGYKRVMKGRKGSGQGIEVVNVTFMPRERIRNAQKAAARCVRVFRTTVTEKLMESKKMFELQANAAAADYRKCWFFQFQKKTDLDRRAFELKGYIEAIEILLRSLKETPPKIVNEGTKKATTPKRAPIMEKVADKGAENTAAAVVDQNLSEKHLAKVEDIPASELTRDAIPSSGFGEATEIKGDPESKKALTTNA